MAKKKVGTIYLLHISGPYCHAQHYLGWCQGDDPTARIGQHRAGAGSPLIRAALDAGCKVKLVKTWKGTRSDERRMKNRHNSKGLCPTCLPEYNRKARLRMRRYRRQLLRAA